MAAAYQARGASMRRAFYLSMIAWESKIIDLVKCPRRKQPPGTIAVSAKKTHSYRTSYEDRFTVLRQKKARWQRRWADNPQDPEVFKERDWSIGMTELFAHVLKPRLPEMTREFSERHIRLWAPELGESEFAERVLIPMLRA